MLVMSNVEVMYLGVIWVLRGVSLELGDGQIATILGANGAGKTTCLKAISGLLKPEMGKVTAGTIQFDGHHLENADPASVLLRLLERIKTSNAEAEGAAPEPGSAPAQPGQPLTPAPLPGAAQSNATIKGDSIRLKEGTLLATLCAAGAGAGIRHFSKG